MTFSEENVCRTCRVMPKEEGKEFCNSCRKRKLTPEELRKEAIAENGTCEDCSIEPKMQKGHRWCWRCSALRDEKKPEIRQFVAAAIAGFLALDKDFGWTGEDFTRTAKNSVAIAIAASDELERRGR